MIGQDAMNYNWPASFYTYARYLDLKMHTRLNLNQRHNPSHKHHRYGDVPSTTYFRTSAITDVVGSSIPST